MFTTFLIGAIALISIGCILTGGKLKRAGDRMMFRVTGFVFLFATLIILGFSTIYYVGATEVGVPVTLGRVGAPVLPGMHVKAPWTGIETLPARPFTLPEDIQISARTSQGGVVVARYGARWVVDPKDAGKVYLQVRTGDEEKISKDLVEKALATAVGNVYAGYENSKATTVRVEAEGSVMTEVNRLLNSYGVKVTQVFLRQVDPDEKTRDSLNRLSAAKNETLIAEQKVQTAKQEALAAQAAAIGAKDATAQIPVNLTPQQVTLYCAQLWANAQEQATARGVTLWTVPCGSGTAPVPLVQSK